MTDLVDPATFPDTSDGIERHARDGRPKVNGKYYSRPSSLGNYLEDTSNLEKWKARRAAQGYITRPELLAQIAAIGPDDTSAAKDQINAIVEAACTAGGADRNREYGTALHKITERIDAGEAVDVPEMWRADVDAYLAATKDFEWLAVERFVVCEALQAAGTPDRYGRTPDGRVVVFDTKGGASLDYGGLKFAIQLATYAHADYFWDGTNVEPIPWDVDKAEGIIVHLEVGSAVCTLHRIDIAAGWEAAQEALRVREWRNRGRKLITPLQLSVSERASTATPPAPTPEPAKETNDEGVRAATSAGDAGRGDGRDGRLPDAGSDRSAGAADGATEPPVPTANPRADVVDDRPRGGRGVLRPQADASVGGGDGRSPVARPWDALEQRRLRAAEIKAAGHGASLLDRWPTRPPTCRHCGVAVVWVEAQPDYDLPAHWTHQPGQFRAGPKCHGYDAVAESVGVQRPSLNEPGDITREEAAAIDTAMEVVEKVHGLFVDDAERDVLKARHDELPSDLRDEFGAWYASTGWNGAYRMTRGQADATIAALHPLNLRAAERKAQVTQHLAMVDEATAEAVLRLVVRPERIDAVLADVGQLLELEAEAVGCVVDAIEGGYMSFVDGVAGGWILDSLPKQGLRDLARPIAERHGLPLPKSAADVVGSPLLAALTWAAQ